jgi:hypothetical protein
VRYLVPVIPPLFLLSASVVAWLPPVVRVAVVALTVLENWLMALTHANLLMMLDFRSVNDLQYAWLRRMYELGLVEAPSAWSWALAATCLAGGVATWWWLFRDERRWSRA